MRYASHQLSASNTLGVGYGSEGGKTAVKLAIVARCIQRIKFNIMYGGEPGV